MPQVEGLQVSLLPSNTPRYEKALECEPRKQTGSRPEQGPLADNCGPFVSFLEWAPLQPRLGHLGRGGSSGGTLGTLRRAAHPSPLGWEGAVPRVLLEAASNHCPNNGKKIAVWERGWRPSGDFPGGVRLCLCSSESPGWRGAGQATHGVTFGAVLSRARSWTR